MKDKKGFTLVELLAVIAILALLVIITLPNVLKIFRNAKEDAFITQVQSIYKAAEQRYLKDSLASGRADVCYDNETNPFELNGQDVKYFLKFNEEGKIIYIVTKDNDYKIIAGNTENKENIRQDEMGTSRSDAKYKSSILEEDIVLPKCFIMNLPSIVFGDGSDGVYPTRGFLSEGKLYKEDGESVLEKLDQIPSKKGHKFLGYYIPDTEDKVIDENGNVVNENVEKLDGPITLEAKWEAVKYYIEFNGNGNTSGEMETMTVMYDEEVTLPLNQYKKTGSIFKGWARSSEASDAEFANGYSGINLTEAGERLTLYAIWEECASGSYSDEETNTCTKTQLIIKYNVGGGTVKASTQTTDGVTKNTWTQDASGIISRSVNGATATQNLQTYNYESSVNLNNYNNPTGLYISKLGYRAVSKAQYKCTSGCSEANKTFDHDVNYKASDFCDITHKDCTVVLTVNWESCPSGTYGVADNANCLSCGTGYTCTGGTNRTANTYKIVYNPNQGTGTTANSTHTYNSEQALTTNGFTRSGYLFAGWAESETATTIKYENGQKVKNLSSKNNDIINLYAVWMKSDYEYTNEIQTLVVPKTGTYKLEVWGAQGGGNGGKGGYSYGNINLTAGENLFIVVGGQGGRPTAGYNGGGKGQVQAGSINPAAYGGGGVTHIATVSGLLSTLNDNISSVIIVAGGGGGGSELGKVGGSGGGTNGGGGSGSCYIAGGGTQTAGGTPGDPVDKSGGSFGQGGSAPWGTTTTGTEGAGGGGGGFFGGGAGSYSSGKNCAGGGGGGSGYVNSNLLIANTYDTSNGERTGNGYAKITIIN